MLAHMRASRRTSSGIPGFVDPQDNPGLRTARFRLNQHELVVLSFPLGVPALPPSLSEAERAVARAVIEGHSNAEIAALRRTSTRTVANQVASVLKKMCVRSRGELVASLERHAL